jgi:hypothetical protein
MPSVNYLAILVSAVAAFAVGMVWYSPALFAKQWMAANGHTSETMDAMKPRMAGIYGLSFVCYLVMGFVMAILARRLGIEYWTGGVKLGGAAWLGFAATVGLTANRFSGKPLAAWLIDAGHQLAFMVVMGVIIAVWR